MNIFKKTSLCAAAIISMVATIHAEGVGIADTEITPDASAILDVQSTHQGALFPRMTSAQRLAIGSPATGLLVYDTDADAFYFNNTNGWAVLGTPLPEEPPVVAFHISSPSGNFSPVPTGGEQPLVLTRTNSDFDFVEGGCVTISNDFPAFSGTTVGYFEAPLDGVYCFQVKCHTSGSSTVALALWKNTLLIGRQYTQPTSNNNPMSFSTTMRLNMGDKVMPGVYAGSGTSINNSAIYTSFSGFLVSPL